MGEVVVVFKIFDDSLGFIVNKVNLRLKAELLRSARAYDVTAEQWGILNFIAEAEGITLTELSDRTLKDKPNINRIIDRLLAKGFLVKEAHPTDKRSHRFYLTESGHILRDALIPIVNGVLTDATRDISDDELSAMKATLDKIYSNLERREQNRG